MKSTYYTETPLATIQLGANLGRILKGGDTVLLFGELGAGKTHFIKGIAEGLGVDGLIKSPTYAYVNTYALRNGRTLYHYDFYRMESWGDFASLGYEETLNDPRAINVVEWADRLEENLPHRYLSVGILAKGNTRSIALDFQYPTRARESLVAQAWDEWATPLHVREHCKKVADVTRQIGEAFIKKGNVVDLNLIYTAALLHDLCRLCDFRALNRDKFFEDVTEEKWQKWQALHEKYPEQHHADIASDWLAKQSYAETAEVVRLHKSINLVFEPDSYDCPEKMIMYYADKRVKHGEVVSLAERLKDGKKRHGQYDTPEQRKVFDEAEKRTYALEQALFKDLDIEPGDI